MEKFVNGLFKSSADLSGLTHRIIRERYLTHTGHKECIGDEKAKLKAIVERKMMEIVAKREHNTATQSPKQKPDKKATATKQKPTETVKKKSKKAVESSESDEESDDASEAISPSASPTSKDSSEEFVMESTHNSSDFEEDSPVRKNIRRPAKRKRYFSDESDSNSDSGQNGTLQKVQKKKPHNLQEKDAKRRNVKPPKSESSDSDSSVKIGKAKRRKHGSGDGKKGGLLGRKDTKSDSGKGKGKGKATNKRSVQQSKRKENVSSGLDSEDTDDNDRLAIVTESDSASSDVNTKVAQKTRKGKGDGFTSDESDATIVDGNSSSCDTVGSGSDAVGSGNGAVGSGSVAVGSGNGAVGSGSDAVGSGSDAVGSGGDAVGSGSDAVGSGSDAVGSGNDAVGSGTGAVGSGSDVVNSGSDSDTVGSQSKKTPQTKGKKKTKLKAQICDSSETDSEAENVQEEKRRHGSGKEPKFAQNGKHGKGTAIKEKKKRPMVTASESDESDISKRHDSNNSDQSDVDTDQEHVTENLKKDSDIFSEQITDEISSGPYSDTARKRSTKRADKNTSAKPKRLRKVSESSEDEIADKRSRTKAGRRLADSDSDSADEQHVPIEKHTSPAKNQKKHKTTLASNSKKLKKPDVQKKSKKQSVSSSDEGSSDVSSEAVMSKSSEKKDLAVRKKKQSGVKGRKVVSQSEDSSSEDEQPLAKVKKETSARESSEDSDTGESSSDANDGGKSHRGKQKKFNKTKQSKASKPKGPSKKVANLKAILRACNAMPVGKRYKIMFGECETDADFVRKLKKLLVAIGMTGRPSMKKAEDIRLKKELAELDTGSIISSKGRSLRDTRCSRFEYGAPVPEPMKRPAAPSCDTFKNLSGLVDSEGSDSST